MQVTTRSVPVVRRQLLAERAKLAVTVVAVAAAVALVLLLNGLRSGINEQVTLYIDRQPPVLVAQAGARNFLTQTSDERLREVADRVLWLEDGRFKTMQALLRDPVCGMVVNPAEAPASLAHDGGRLFFCSRGCRDEFAAS